MNTERVLPRRLTHAIAETMLWLACGLAAWGAGTPDKRASYSVGDTVEYRLGQTWFEVRIVKVEDSKYYVHRNGHSTSHFLTWDRWASGDELRPVVAKLVARARAQKGDATLDGLYLQVQTRTVSGRRTMAYQHYWFRPGGSLYFGVPPGGLAKPAGFAALQEREPQNCGTYGVVGDKLTLQRNGQKAETFDFSNENAGAVLHFSGPGAVKVGQFKDHQILEGNYEGGGMAAGGGAIVLAADHFHFHRNGTFESASAAGFSSTRERGSAGGGGSEPSGKGKYQLDGNTLQLAYLDGKTISFTVYPYPEKAEFPPRHIGINGQMYKLQPTH